METFDDEHQVPASRLAEELTDRTAMGIAAAVSRLIRQGEVAAGVRLPTVRELAPVLGVSPATVSAAWSTLRKQRAVRGVGRQGTWVLGPPAAPRPARYGHLGDYWGTTPLDLTLAAPDPDLLPDLRPAVAAALQGHDLSSYDRAPITPALEAAVRLSWPWQAAAWMAVNGGYEGLQVLLQGTVVPGDVVAVEEPSTPRTLDILDSIGVRLVPVVTDAFGPRVESLRRALGSDPVAFVYEPRAGSGTGAALTPERASELAALLRPTSVLVVEDDGVGEVSALPYAGLGPLLPEQTVLVRSYSKSHGPDLRLAVVGGPADALTRAHSSRQFGAGWTSRLLQDSLAWMLQDAASRACVDRAAEVYRERREHLISLLADQGVQIHNRDGLALWVPVLDETQALVALASHGIAAIPGTQFRMRAGPPAVRVSISHRLDDPQFVADALVRAARAWA